VRYYEFVRVSSKLKLTIGQINGLRSFIEKTNGKREYRRAVAVFQKADGKTYDYIAREHRVHIRTTKKWIDDHIKKGIEGPKIRENHGGRKPRITDESKEIILSQQRVVSFFNL
jgi:transposase